MLGRQAIFNRRDGGPEFVRQPSAMFVVHGRVTRSRRRRRPFRHQRGVSATSEKL
jgi:hypothetical protein